MEQPNYQEGTTSAQDPPPYAEKQQPLLANPTMPTQYTMYGSMSGQGPVTQPPLHTTIVIPVQPVYKQDYLGYSIFTMLCCCLPLGIVALVYSIRTRDANHMGDIIEAQRNSRMARNFANSALIVGIVFIIVYIVLVVVLSQQQN